MSVLFRSPLPQFLLAFAVLSLLPSPTRAEAGEGSRERFFFAVGANDGGPGRARLRYAGKDASSMAALMREMGGVPAENAFILEDPDRRSFHAAWSELLARIERERAEGAQTEVFFYYSGHSTDESLIWGREHLGYAELREGLGRLGADVVVAILDSCASGAFTRMKGGVLRPAFLQDESRRVKGHAYLTSSSADEVAQESDHIGGSFFTHHLVAGLRGAADAKGTGRVTLHDAYRYAFEETLAQTERSRGGPQHPVYEIDLVGSGELVVTDLTKVSATLDLDPGILGRVFVRDAAGDLVLEARKRQGAPLRLGLAPGAYTITVVHGDDAYEGSVTLGQNQSATITLEDLRLAAPQTASYRKGEVDREGTHRVVPFEFSVFPSLSTDGGPRPTTTRFSLYLFAADGDRLDGTQIGAGVGRMREDVEGAQIAGIGNLVGADVDGLQMSGVFNHTGGNLSGVQLAGISNLVRGEVRHLQMAGISNVAGGSLRGLQMAGISNVATADVRGFQVAGISNVASGSVSGLQLAGILNLSPEVDGLQYGAVNLARNVGGLQVGTVNVAGEARGVQMGVVNVASSATAPIGLLNLIGDGRFRVGIWGSDLAIPQIHLKTGSKTVHSILFAGIRPGTWDEDPIWTMGAGLGLHLGFRRLGLHFVEPELVMTNVFDGAIDSESHAFVSSLRLGLGRDLPFGFSIFAGPSLNVSVQEGDLRDERVGIIPAAHISAGDQAVHIWPGFFAGIEI